MRRMKISSSHIDSLHQLKMEDIASITPDKLTFLIGKCPFITSRRVDIPEDTNNL